MEIHCITITRQSNFLINRESKNVFYCSVYLSPLRPFAAANYEFKIVYIQHLAAAINVHSLYPFYSIGFMFMHHSQKKTTTKQKLERLTVQHRFNLTRNEIINLLITDI